MKYNKLRGKIVEKYGSITAMADAINMSRVALSRKLSGKSDFTQGEIKKIMGVLDIPESKCVEYFF